MGDSARLHVVSKYGRCSSKFGLLLLLLSGTQDAIAASLSDISLPVGFRIQQYTTSVPNARSLALSTYSAARIVYVSTRQLTNVYATIDSDIDGTVDTVRTIISGYNTPNGIAYREGALFVAQINRVLRFDNVDTYALNGQGLPAPTVISPAFPSDASHGWKYIAFGPDGKLYIPVGAPCNICELQSFGDIAYGTINRMNVDGSDLEIFAAGIRNTVGFDWHPETGELYFTENGRDSMGDDAPDCELDHAPTAGLDFGYPFCHTGGTGTPEERGAGIGPPLNDPTLNSAGSRMQCSDASSHTRALQALGPHLAPLGMKFYSGSMFPAGYTNAIFIAEHGSWDRAAKIGYRVSVVKLSADGRTATTRETFASGWLQGQSSWGRPVDILQMPDGALLVSDDAAGAVYRISYSQSETTTPMPTAGGVGSPRSAAPLRASVAGTSFFVQIILSVAVAWAMLLT